jgi:hypothetical protein
MLKDTLSYFIIIFELDAHVTLWHQKTLRLVGVYRPASNFSAIFRMRTFKNLNATGLETRKGDGYGRIILPVQQVSYGPLIMSIMLKMSCYTGFFNVRRGWQSLNTGPRVSFTSHPQDGLVVNFYIPHNRPTKLSFPED